MNKKYLTAVLALVVAAATLVGCTSAPTKPEVPVTPDTTTQAPETPGSETPQPPDSSGVDSEWSADEVSVLTETTDELDIRITIWDGKTIDGPTPHPWLGGGDFTITMPDGWYGNPEWIMIPFRVELTNITSSVLPQTGVGGRHATDTEVFVALEGTDMEYHAVERLAYVQVEDVEPGQTVVATGYLMMPTYEVTSDTTGLGATWVIVCGSEGINASIVYRDPPGRYMPRDAIIG